MASTSRAVHGDELCNIVIIMCTINIVGHYHPLSGLECYQDSTGSYCRPVLLRFWIPSIACLSISFVVNGKSSRGVEVNEVETRELSTIENETIPLIHKTPKSSKRPR